MTTADAEHDDGGVGGSGYSDNNDGVARDANGWYQ